MDKKEIIIRLIRSICLTVVFGFIIMIMFAPILQSVNFVNLLLDTEEGVGWVAAILFFFIIVLTPLPKIKYNMFVFIRSIIVTLLVSYLIFVGGRQIPGVHTFNLLIIIVPLLFLGLILFSWKRQAVE